MFLSFACRKRNEYELEFEDEGDDSGTIATLERLFSAFHVFLIIDWRVLMIGLCASQRISLANPRIIFVPKSSSYSSSSVSV